MAVTKPAQATVQIGYPWLSPRQTNKAAVHLIIGTLIGLVFSCLLLKALIETAWGLCLIAYGRGLRLLATGLRILAKIVRFVGRTRHRKELVEEPQRLSIVSSFTMVNAYRSKQTAPLSQAHPREKSPTCWKSK